MSKSCYSCRHWYPVVGYALGHCEKSGLKLWIDNDYKMLRREACSRSNETCEEFVKSTRKRFDTDY
jgi:hypothetical protein